MRAAPSNSWSIAPKTLPCAAMSSCRAVADVAECQSEASTRAAASQSTVPRAAVNRGRRYNDVMKSSTPNRKARWERETLEPRAKSPERARPFTTISGRPIERLYTPRRSAGARLRARHRRSRRVSRTRAASIRPAIAASSGRCGSSPGSGRRRRPTQRYKAAARGRRHRPERRVRSADADGPRSRSPLSLGEVGKCGVNVDVAGRHGAAVRRASRSPTSRRR